MNLILIIKTGSVNEAVGTCSVVIWKLFFFQVTLMAVTDADVKRGLTTPIWDTYQEIVNKAEGRDVRITTLERFAFYERAKKAYAVVNTG
jgi:L-fucose mutarotase/ribose pyranase (RbsD/FucU family)